MPFYINDPDAPGKHADVIEVQLRNPLRELDPIQMKGWMKRDLWTRREALLLLSGYDPNGTDWGGHTLVACHEPGPRVGYLDGTTDRLLHHRSARHPRHQVNFEHILTLSEYAAGCAIDETKPPAAWIEWAAGKDFIPHWLSWIEGAGSTALVGCGVLAQTATTTDPSRMKQDIPTSPVLDGPTTPVEAKSEQLIPKKKRRDVIAVVIDEVVARLKARGAHAGTAEVWNELHAIARDDDRIDVAADGSGITWVRGNNTPATLTYSKLSDRLREASHN